MMENSGNEMAYTIIIISIIVFISSFYIDKIDFSSNKKEH